MQYLFQETLYDDVPGPGRPTEESSLAESDRRRAGCIDINSFLFGIDLADHFGNFGRQGKKWSMIAITDTCSKQLDILKKTAFEMGCHYVKSERVMHSLRGLS